MSSFSGSSLAEALPSSEVEADSAVVPGAHGGCFLATCPLPIEDSRYTLPPWALGVDRYRDEDDDDDEEEEGPPPDLSIDPEDGVLTLINASAGSKSYFVTVDSCARIVSAEGHDLLEDTEGGARRSYVTFVAVVGPNTLMDLVTLVPRAPAAGKSKKGKKKKASGGRLSSAALASIGISSDIQEYSPRPAPPSTPLELEVFPLLAAGGTDRWLCTQSSGGSLTHFAHPSTFHAVDFRCAVGTPVVSVWDATVMEVRRDSAISGVHVSNLFEFNSIMLSKDGDEELYIEYVHIHREGVAVAVGDSVRRGQLLCLSGDAGFCPEPHLHLQVQRGRDPGAPSVPLTLGGEAIVAGQYYPRSARESS